MDLLYFITPFFAWLVAGGTKIIINSLKAGELAFKQISYSGLPSNHSSIVSSVAAMVVLQEGVNSAAFGGAVALAFIVILDAASLHKHIGEQAAEINKLKEYKDEMLRESIGHTRIEIIAGLIVGVATAFFLYKVFASFSFR